MTSTPLLPFRSSFFTKPSLWNTYVFRQTASFALTRRITSTATFSTTRQPYTKPDGGAFKRNKRFLVGFLTCAVTGGGSAFYYYYYHLKESSPFHPLSPFEFRPYTLSQVRPLTPTVSVFRFSFAPEKLEDVSRIPVASVLLMKDDTCQIARPYTPLHVDEDGFEVAVKRYENGQASRFLHDVCKQGRRVEFRGPLQAMPDIPEVANVGMIAGGTGITAMYQLLQYYFPHSANNRRSISPPKISLVYAATEPSELFLREELDQLARLHPENFKVTYLVDGIPENLDQSAEDLGVKIGRVSKEIIRETMPGPEGEQSIILVCGPNAMLRHIAGDRPLHSDIYKLTTPQPGGILAKLGYTANQVFKF